METTVIQHVLSRLHDIGIRDVFVLPVTSRFRSTMPSPQTETFDGLDVAMNSTPPTLPMATLVSTA